MKAKEIIKIIENVCPERLAYSWDNVGLLCGDEYKDVKRYLLRLILISIPLKRLYQKLPI